MSAPGAPTITSITPGNTSLSVAFTAGTGTITNYQYSTNNGTTWVTRSPLSVASPISITGLTNGTSYTVVIRALNGATTGEISNSIVATPRTVPGAPTAVSASAQSSTSVNVSFTAPVSNGGNAITSYIVTPYIGAVAQATTSGSSSPITINLLTTGQTYTFRVNAVNDAGNGALSTASSSLFMLYFPLTSPSGINLTYLTGVIAPSATVINNSTIRYTDTNFADVVIEPTGSAWTITMGELTDTLIKVRKIVLNDKVIYLLGSGADAGTVITNSPTTIGSYTMSTTNTGGIEYLWNYNVNALSEYNTNAKTAVIYFAGDTIYSPSNSGTVLNNFSSTMSIIGKNLNNNKPLLTRPNANNPFLQFWSSNITIENVILDLYVTITDTYNAIDIIGSNYNLNLIENITFKDVNMQRANQRGIQLYYVNNIMFDNCIFSKAAARATIGISSGKNVTIKNSTIPKSGASQLNFGSIYINSANGPSTIYASGQILNTDRVNWTDAQKLASLETSIDLSGNNTFTDDLSTGNAIILIDSYRAANLTIQPSITYSGVSPKVNLPTGFGYAFNYYAYAGVNIPVVYITKNSTDIPSANWGAIDPSTISVYNLSTNKRIYPIGYELSNTVFDPSTITTETEIPLKIGGSRVIVPILPTNSVGSLSDLSPVFITDVSVNPKLVVFTASDVGVAVLNSINNIINAVCIKRIVNSSTIISVMDVIKRSSVSSTSVTKTINSQIQTLTADISSLLSTYNILLNINDIDNTLGLKASAYFKVIDSSGNIITSNFSVPIEFQIPGTDSINFLDLYRYNTTTSTYVKINTLNKKINTTNTFSYTFTNNSDYQLIKPVPSAPILSTTAGDMFVELDWTQPSGYDITSYKIYRDNNLITTITNNQVYTDNELTNGTTYFYSVSAVNDMGEGDKSEVSSATPDGIAFAPVNLIATSSDSSINLSWDSSNPNGGSIIKYNVYYRNVSDISYTKIDTLSYDVSYNLTGLTNGTSYNVYVTAVDQIGESNGSSIQTVTPRSVPKAPTINSIIPDITTFSIAFTAGSDGGLPILDYEYTIDDEKTWVSANKTTSPLVISGLKTNQTYSFIIRAINSLGNGNSSNKINAIAIVGATTYLDDPIKIAPIVSDNAGVSSFEIKIENTQFTSNTGVAYALNTGTTGVVGLFTINAFDVTNNPITNFSANPITVNINLPNANPLNSPLKMYKRVNENTNTLLDPQPSGYPVNVTYVSGDLWTTTLTSLSSYLIKDPNSSSASAGGDPHLKRIDNTIVIIPNDWKYIRLYECSDIKVCGKCEYISDNIISRLHKKDKNIIIPINIKKTTDQYITKFTYFTELDFYKNNEICIRLNTITGRILYNNKKILIDNIWNSKKGIYSLTHKCKYEPKEYIEYCVHLYNGDYLEVGIDNFWDDINNLELYISKQNTDYKGEFFYNDIENSK